MTQKNWKCLYAYNRQYTEFLILTFFSPLGFDIQTHSDYEIPHQALLSQSFKTISQQENFDTWSRNSNDFKIPNALIFETYFTKVRVKKGLTNYEYPFAGLYVGAWVYGQVDWLPDRPEGLNTK